MTLVVKGEYEQIPVEKLEGLNSHSMALIAFTIQNFLEIMFDEIKRAKFSSLEFLEKSELFLSSVTPSYSKDNFAIIIQVLEEVDPNFPNSKFQYGLTSLREICTHESENVKVMLTDIGINLENYTLINSALIFFATHLITNLIIFIQDVRKIPSISNMSIDELRYYVSSNFHHCLAFTLTQTGQGSEKNH